MDCLLGPFKEPNLLTKLYVPNLNEAVGMTSGKDLPIAGNSQASSEIAYLVLERKYFSLGEVYNLELFSILRDSGERASVEREGKKLGGEVVDFYSSQLASGFSRMQL